MAPTYNFAKFLQKLYEIERIWTPGGASKILLCSSVNAHNVQARMLHQNQTTRDFIFKMNNTNSPLLNYYLEKVLFLYKKLQLSINIPT